MRTIRLALDAINKGYRFDDDKAPKYLEAFTMALDNLAIEANFLDQILATVDDG